MKTTIALILIFLALPVQAELYKWVDDNGVTHFSNTAPPKHAQAEIKTEVKGNTHHAPDNSLNDVLDNYREQNRQDAYDKKVRAIEDRYDEKRKAKNEELKAKYKRLINDRERDVQRWKDRLNDVKKERYSDKKAHDRKVQHCQDMLADYQSALERLKARYDTID